MAVFRGQMPTGYFRSWNNVIVMLGEMTGKNVLRIQNLGWGRMWVAFSRNIYTYPGEPWGFDNGAFRHWVAGETFDRDAYARRLDQAREVGAPRLAVLPDIVAGGKASLDLSWSWVDKETDPSWPWYLAVQDGLEPEDATPFLGKIAGVFLGGTKRYKSRARDWRGWAHANGILFHYARAGSLRALTHAQEVGADSIDSAFPMWTQERWQLFEEQWKNGPSQTSLFA